MSSDSEPEPVFKFYKPRKAINTSFKSRKDFKKINFPNITNWSVLDEKELDWDQFISYCNYFLQSWHLFTIGSTNDEIFWRKRAKFAETGKLFLKFKKIIPDDYKFKRQRYNIPVFIDKRFSINLKKNKKKALKQMSLEDEEPRSTDFNTGFIYGLFVNPVDSFGGALP